MDTKKTITIHGKKNVDATIKKKSERNEIINKNLDTDEFLHKTQVENINKLYFNEHINQEKLYKRELNKKINNYKNQDVQKNLLTTVISLDETVEKLVASKLQCHYCKDNCFIVYKDVLEKKQWTLDRIDNDKGHRNDNVVICCLECNIRRGRMDCDRFKQGKSIRIVRKCF
jgi:hypothetical protein